MTNLENQFEQEMLQLYVLAKQECGYNATRFLRLVSEKGGLAAAKQLIRKEGGTDGFASLWGQAGEWMVTVCLTLFAFTSLVGAGYYGRRGVETLTRSRFVLGVYHVAFPLCVVAGAVGDLAAVWELVDLCNGLLAIPNLVALLLLSPVALRSLREWQTINKMKKNEKGC